MLVQLGTNKPNRFLAVIGLFFVISVVWFVYKLQDISNIVFSINIFSFALVLFPIYNITAFIISTHTVNSNPELTIADQSIEKPDIYYIILDGYSRADTLEKMGFDNSSFIHQLENIGFYVADCSISNYRNTVNSVAASLNMDYLWRSIPNNGEKDTRTTALYDSIKHSAIRNKLEGFGYKTIGFETGYAWLNITDAYLFSTPDINYYWADTLLPFEELLIRTTALKPLIDRNIIHFTQNNTTQKNFSQFENHYKIVQHALDSLPAIAKEVEGPKFVYLHLVTPHAPYIFLPDGSFNPDSNFYADPYGNGTGLTQEYSIEGYLNNIRFINKRILNVLKEIIENSSNPPVIILQGDHGLIFEEYKNNIFNSYYFPDNNYSKLYSTISPVNSFRVVLNKYLLIEEDMTLVKDRSISTDIGRPFRKTNSRNNPANPDICPRN
jgi:hypothetical protein